MTPKEYDDLTDAAWNVIRREVIPPIASDPDRQLLAASVWLVIQAINGTIENEKGDD